MLSEIAASHLRDARSRRAPLGSAPHCAEYPQGIVRLGLRAGWLHQPPLDIDQRGRLDSRRPDSCAILMR